MDCVKDGGMEKVKLKSVSGHWQPCRRDMKGSRVKINLRLLPGARLAMSTLTPLPSTPSHLSHAPRQLCERSPVHARIFILTLHGGRFAPLPARPPAFTLSYSPEQLCKCAFVGTRVFLRPLHGICFATASLCPCLTSPLYTSTLPQHT